MIQDHRLSNSSKHNVSGLGHCFVLFRCCICGGTNRVVATVILILNPCVLRLLTLFHFEMCQKCVGITTQQWNDVLSYHTCIGARFYSQTCRSILDGQINDSYRSKMVSVCILVSSFLFTDLLCSRILYRCLRFRNFLIEQLYCLFVSFGRPQRYPRPSDHRKGGQRI